MVDSEKDEKPPLPKLDEGNLIKQIDELEVLLAEKKAEAEAQKKSREAEPILPRLNVGTDGIPVLVEAVTEEQLATNGSSPNAIKNEDELVTDIIEKIDKEITEDLDELILMLKDSIIDEVKTRLIKELHLNENSLNKNK